MSYARDFAFDGLRGASQDRLATWYQQGLSDGLGDRLLMFDNSTSPSLELLRFRPDLTARPGFEVALRERLRRLSHFQHEGFAQVRTVEYLGDRDGLALITNYTPGKRLSEILRDARGPWLAASLVRQLTPALAALQSQDRGIIHAAVGPDRIFVTPEGKLVIVEHVLGSAIQRLELSSDRLAELGIAVPPSPENTSARLDSRTDFFQLGLVALSLLLGRAIGVHEYKSHVSDLLDELTTTGGRTGFTLRRWLERALFVNGAGFESAVDAEAASRGLPAEPEARHDDRLRALIAAPAAASVPVETVEPPRSATVSHLDAPRPEIRPALDVPADSARGDAAPFSDTLRTAEPPWPLIEIIKPTDLSPIEQSFPVPPPEVKAPAAIDLSTTPPDIAPARPTERSIAHVDYLRRPEPTPREPAAPPPRAREYEPPPPPPPRPVSVPAAPQVVAPPVQEPVAPSPAALAPPAPGQAAPAPAALAPPPPATAGPAGVAAATVAEATSPTSAQTAEAPPDQPPATPAPRVLPTRPRAPAKPVPKRLSVVSQWFTAIVVGCAIGEAIVIGFFMWGRSGAKPADVGDPATAAVADSRSKGLPAAPEKSPVPTGQPAGRASAPPTTPGDAGTVATAGRQPKDRASRSTDRAATALTRSTGFTISSPLELQVYEGERLLGSTSDGIINAPPGRREVDLVNTRVGYRARQTVYVRPGTIASIGVALPSGRVSVNAAPWAEVFIDGKSVGETPLGNLSVPIGEHEFVFRHPQLGERRQTATVRADGVTRVTADLQR